MKDIVIIGGGPAGLTAAIYACRSGKSVLILEKAGFGGQIAWSPRVENFPGVGAVSGAELAERMLMQAIELGADTDIGTVNAITRDGSVWHVLTEEGEDYGAWSVILAVGAEHRPIGLPGERELCGSGVSYCAVCDGAFYADQDVVVAGGGDTALQDALLLADICRHVTVIHRRGDFRGERRLLEKLRGKLNVALVNPAQIKALAAENGKLCAVTVEDLQSGATHDLTVSGLFVAYGQEPATGDFRRLFPVDAGGYVRAGEDCAVGEDGLFAAGDCRSKGVRQLTTAVSDGAYAAVGACRYLDNL